MRARQHQKQRRGGAVVEMAAVMPIFIALVLGQIEMSRLGMVSQLLTTGAREGCRVAVIGGSTSSQVQSQVNSFLTAAGIPTQTLSAVDTDPGTAGLYIMPSNWSTASGGTAITVVVRVSYSSVSWLPKPTYLKNATVGGVATLYSERP